MTFLSEGSYFIHGIGIEINGGPYQLYSDGNEREESHYISIGETKAAFRASESLNFVFTVDNPFFLMRESDRLLGVVRRGASILFEDRIAEGLISKISIYPDDRSKGSHGVLIDGKLGIRSDAYVAFAEGDYTPVPCEITVVGNEGEEHPLKNLGVKEGDESIVINSYCQVGILGDEGFRPAKGFEHHELMLDLIKNYEDYTLSDYYLFAQGIGLKILLATDSRKDTESCEVKRVMNLLAETPQIYKEIIKGIYFRSMKPWEHGMADGKLGLLFMKSGEISAARVSSFFHEAAHILIDSMDDKKREQFRQRWLEIAGDVYGKDVVAEKIERWYGSDNTYIKWDDTTSEIYNNADASCSTKTTMLNARHGLLEPYGATSVDEDIALYVGEFLEYPESFIPLIDPLSGRYDIRYIQKIGLLIEVGFIPKERAPVWLAAYQICA
ncbi:MAG: hypothetical protein HYT75_02310 [Deltaproteobacteria bacterium]|nr:hypothetical protein [Deltaproteobacteria bacterium]